MNQNLRGWGLGIWTPGLGVGEAQALLTLLLRGCRSWGLERCLCIALGGPTSLGAWRAPWTLTWAVAAAIPSTAPHPMPHLQPGNLETRMLAVAVNGCAEACPGNIVSARRLPVSYNVIFRIGNFAPFLQRTSFA